MKTSGHLIRVAGLLENLWRDVIRSPAQRSATIMITVEGSGQTEVAYAQLYILQ